MKTVDPALVMHIFTVIIVGLWIILVNVKNHDLKRILLGCQIGVFISQVMVLIAGLL